MEPSCLTPPELTDTIMTPIYIATIENEEDEDSGVNSLMIVHALGA